MNEFGFFKDEKLFLKAMLDFPEREIGELRTTEEETIKYFIERYELFVKEVDDLEETINNTENKGSYLMKILHLQTQLGEAKILGDIAPLHQRLELLKNSINTQIENNRRKNTTFKQAMIEEASAIIDAKMWNEGIERIKEIQKNWIKTGKAEENIDSELETKFTDLTNTFFDERKLYFEERKELSEARVQKYQTLVEQAEQLKDGDTVNELKATWKSLGGIPASIYKEKLDAFNAALNKVKSSDKKSEHTKSRHNSNNTDLTSQRKELLKELEAVWETQPKKFIYQVKDIQKNFSSLRGRFSNEDKKIADLFYALCDKLHELNFVKFQVEEKLKISPDDKEKYTPAITKTLNKLIRRDKEELKTFEENAENMLMFSSGDAEKLFKGQLRLKQRKLLAKQKILSHFTEK